MSYFHLFDQIKGEELIPGFTGKVIHTAGMTLVMWDIKAGAALPEHAHPHEQSTLLLNGKFELTVDGETKTCELGMISVIPSNIPHSGRALTDVRLFDVFRPQREDLPGMQV